MKSLISSLIGLVLSVSVGAEPLLEGRVRLASGEPVADAQVRIFDMTDLQRGAIARATTDGTGYFALPLATLTGRALPERFALGPNYPNPFNPSTIIPYQLAASAPMRLEVFNLLGQRIATLVDGERPAGFHTATWHATDASGRAVGAGVYIYRMTVGVESQTGRMVLIDGQAGISAGGTASVMPGASGVSGSNGEGEQVYGLIVSGSGLVPYVDSAFRVEVGMAPVELVVSSGHSGGKAADDDCAFCDLFDALNDEEEGPGPSGKAQAALEAPPAPTNLRFEAVTDSSCTVRWDAAEGATDYDVNYKPAVGGKWTNEPHRGIGLYNTIHDLEPGTEYRWAVRAENEDGRSEWVFGPNFTTVEEETDETTEEEAADGQAPPAPTNLRFDAPTDSSCTVRWDAAEGATDYDVNYKPAVGGRWTNEPHRGTGLYNTINDLEPGTEYRWAVRAENGEGRSEWVFGPNFTTVGADGQVTIPDAKLRAAIEAALGKASGATITQAEMAILTFLGAYEVGISDLTGLEFATNLIDLNLAGNNISDIAPLSGLTNLTLLLLLSNNISDISVLSGLTNLTFLWLDGNNISDIAALSGLTNLTNLGLAGNNISDIAPLSGLTGLTHLRLDGNNISDIAVLSGLTNLTGLGLNFNNISDITVLSGLTNLTYLGLDGNNISDISMLSGLTGLTQLKLDLNDLTDVSALSGLTRLAYLDLRGNFLNSSSINDHIPALMGRGVAVRFDPLLRESDFDIELVFLDRFTEKRKRIIQHAARRWESIIAEDLPDYEFTQGWSGTWGDQSYEIPAGERIDDLRIYVVSQPDEDRFDWGGVRMVRPSPHLPILGGMSVSSNSLDIALHEIGHVMGIGTLWKASGFLQDFPSADPHFNGPRAIAAFNAAGGRGYAGAKVPVETEGRGAGGHWRSSVFLGELMDRTYDRPGSNGPLSAITIQALADLGYDVDVTQADPYTLPDAAAKASAKITAPSTHAEPEWSCGTGQQQEPIYVVDEQGNIIRTLHR